MKKYIVTYIDQNKEGASLPFALHQAFNTKEEARQAIIDDLESITEGHYELNENHHGVLKAEIEGDDSLETVIYNIQIIEV